jgi:hypothetical protein
MPLRACGWNENGKPKLKAPSFENKPQAGYVGHMYLGQGTQLRGGRGAVEMKYDGEVMISEAVDSDGGVRRCRNDTINQLRQNWAATWGYWVGSHTCSARQQRGLREKHDIERGNG